MQKLKNVVLCLENCMELRVSQEDIDFWKMGELTDSEFFDEDDVNSPKNCNRFAIRFHKLIFEESEEERKELVDFWKLHYYESYSICQIRFEYEDGSYKIFIAPYCGMNENSLQHVSVYAHRNWNIKNDIADETCTSLEIFIKINPE